MRFATKPQLARQLIARVRDAGLPCAWVVADSVYGNDGDLRLWLEGRQRWLLARRSLKDRSERAYYVVLRAQDDQLGGDGAGGRGTLGH